MLVLVAMLALTVLVAQRSDAKGGKFKPYEVDVCWTMSHTDGVEGTYQWPQTRGCQPPACEETVEQQHDTYWIRDRDDEAYLAGLTGLNSPADDARLEPHGYYSVVLTGPECETPTEEPTPTDDPTPTDEPTPSETPTAPPTSTPDPEPTPTPTAPGEPTAPPTIVTPDVPPTVTEPPTFGPPEVGTPNTEVRTLHRYTCTAKWSVTQEKRDGDWVTVDSTPKVPIDGDCVEGPEGPRFDETGL